ncbi:DUF4625 domain-containing protein [Pontibacter sp. SGAir0037]|uniref:DUF4625 domain-containing protein n=1 Tax=Pontibacter sp. SGAir0037 TaxID=2571030 RepID=UPI0010CCF193|nr:DUF4625 domain-containing protein [Pontibacter sp. SGAir0037]QCR21725.1 hypothetical protein C1N53_04790 [Pontibacter sp. SGAir0037]
MKNTFKLFGYSLLLLVLLVSCNKDEDEVTPVPAFTEIEIGSNNSKIAYAGSDLHLDAAIVAPGTIASVRVEIHPESGSGWEFNEVYTEGLAGKKNADFHKHIDIPASAATGHYHFHLVVTDNLGQKAEIDEEIEIKEDATLPSISGLQIEVEDGGNEIHVETTINAPNRIAEVKVEVHGAWEKEFEFDDAAMVGQTSYEFHKHINIAAAPAGHYHLHFTVIDQAGKEREFEGHFDKP